MSDIETRLATLERQVRRWRAATAAVVLGGVAALVIGAQREPKAPAAITATGLTIVSADGKTLATLGTDKESKDAGAVFVLHNAAGDPLVTARAAKDNASLSVGPAAVPGTQNTATMVAWKKAGGGNVMIRATKGNGAAAMLIDGDGGAGGGVFATAGEDGETSWRSAAAQSKKKGLVPFDPTK